MSDKLNSELIRAALEAQRNAYAPYSCFQVGAALRTAGGTVYRGANVENASLGLTICAERVAAAAGVAAGERQFQALALASPGGVAPCGACCQFLAEFSRDLKILLVNSLDPGQIDEMGLAQLLTRPFAPPD
jgi:cytidine deaminase